MRFQDRVSSGDIDRLSGGRVAGSLKLAEQYKMHDKGDVARRLDLHKHAGAGPGASHSSHAGRHDDGRPAVDYFPHHGRVSRSYYDDCFQHSYHGPSYYPRYSWYPKWSGWVDWSWHLRCHPVWDPRPYWCRPISYASAPVWVYWHYPVWHPLSAVVCGTWVDVAPVAVGPQHDLQLLAVRFVDPGHPDENLGPRFRIWFRNNSQLPVTRPLSVMLLAANDAVPADGLPQAGVRVTAVEAGETQAVDIRLPIEALGMGIDEQGAPAAFSMLHVLVDAHNELPEISEVNNGTVLPVAEVLPVDPAAFELEPVSSPAGGEVLLAGEGFGPQPGRVLVKLGQLELEGEILGWYDLGVRVRLPQIHLVSPAQAELIVIRGDGAAANPLAVTITPPLARPTVLGW